MAKKYRWIVTFLTLIFYSLLYIATSRDTCIDDCAKVTQVGQSLSSRNYVYAVYRCSYTHISDTLCVFVKDTTGINWSLLADTTCMIASQYGLSRQKVFVIKNTIFPPDTVARVQCP